MGKGIPGNYAPKKKSFNINGVKSTEKTENRNT